jgi:hypothetical protein
MKKWLVGLMAAGLCAASAWATDYTLITSVSDLTAGDYVILDGSLNSAMKNTVDSQKRIVAQDDIAVTDGVISDPDSSIVWSLSKSGDNWVISNVTADGTLYAAAPTSAGNKSRLLAEEDGNFTLWTITDSTKADGLIAVQSCQYTDRYLQRNSAAASQFFACYTGTQKDLRFFKGGEVTPPKFSIKLTPSFSGDSVLVGDEATITASAQNAAGEVTYRWSAEGVPGSAAGAVFTIDTAAAGGPYTVTCDANDTDSDADPVSVTFSIAEPPEGTDYTLVESLDGLQDGAEVVLTDPDSGYALSSTLAKDVFGVVAVKPVNDVITTDDATIVWKLEADASGNFSLLNKGADQYAGHAGGGSSNTGRLQTNSFPHAVTFGEDKLFVLTATTADSAGNNRTLQYNYNGGNPRFAYYKGTQKNLRIYAAETGPATFSLALTASATEVEQGDPLTITATVKNAEGEVAYVWQVGMGVVGEAHVTYYTVDTASMEPGDYQVGCKAQDAVADPITETVTFTVKAPVTKYDVILPVGGNGFITATPEKAAAGADVALTATANSGYKFVEMSVIGVDSGDTIATFTTSTGTFKMPAEDVRVGATFEPKSGDVFKKISSAAELEEGDYVFVGSATDGIKAMQAAIPASGTKYFYAKDVEIENDEITDPDDDLVWTLAKDGDNWTIYNSAVGYAAYPGSGNAASAEKPASDSSRWTIAYGEDKFFEVKNVAAAATPTNRYLHYNTQTNAHRFACYTSVTLANSMAFYKKEGVSVPTVKYSGDTTVTLPDGEFSIQFSLKGYEGEYTWVKDGREGGSIDESTGLYTWKPTEANDEINITVRAVDGETVIASTDVTLVVKEAPKSYIVEVADGIINGTVKISVGGETFEGSATVPEGTTVTLIPEPVDRSYKLGSISVKTDGGQDVELDADYSFPMPSDNVTVYAEFVENEVAPYYFQFEDSELPGNYSGTSAELVNAGTTAGDFPKVAFALQRACRGNADNDRKVGTAAMRLAPVGGTNAIACNSAKFSEAITAISFQYAIYGNDKIDSFTVSTSEDGENWNPLADLTEKATTALQTYESQVSGNAFFIRFEATSTVKDNNHRLNIDEIQLWTGEPEPSISYDSSLATVVLPASFSIPFELKNFESEFPVEWRLAEGEGAIDKDTGVYTWTPTQAGYYDITVEAIVDGVMVAETDVTLTVIDMMPGEITLTCDPASVTMAEGESVDVTVTLDGVDSFDGYIYIVDHEDMCSEQGENPWTFDLADLGLSASDEPYVLTLIAYDGDGELAQTTLNVTVSGEGPQPGVQPVITGIDVQSDKVVVTFTGDGSAVEGTDDLGADWSPVDATISGGTATVPNAKRFLRIRQ